MTNPQLTEAMKEAYASAPSTAVILHTLELRNANFESDGMLQPIRVVHDRKNWDLTLEADAPVNGGETVTFVAFAFEFALPSVTELASPEIIVKIDNVSREIVLNIERATQSLNPVELTYRPYLTDDTTKPQWTPPLHLTLHNISADVHSVTGSARFGDLANKTFPSAVYSALNFPGLVRG